jgi:hypothetical protein
VKCISSIREAFGELKDLYSPNNIIRVTELRKMRWPVHGAHMRERRGLYRILVGKPQGK